ncbi:MAG: phosphorylase [Actinobacteria bacterium]|nr:MAG: phosphorylase [Actinomycetota bacterium]
MVKKDIAKNINSDLHASFAIIGGSSTHSIDFPVGQAKVKILDEKEIDTPYGKSPQFRLFEYNGKKILTCKMHGWRNGISRADASMQVFWVLQQAGVKTILGEGGVGALSKRLKTRDLIIPHDFVDLSSRRNLVLNGSHLLIMREPFCQNIQKAIVNSCVDEGKERVFEEGVYVCTDGNRFETKAEINMMKNWGDIVGQSLGPEASLARDIGACYGSLQMVVNYAEGIVGQWDYDEFKDIFFSESQSIANILLKSLSLLDEKASCQCANQRKKSLLK